MRWWELPGPLSFATEVVDDLRQGKNVIVYLPAYTPGGLHAATREVFGREHSWKTIRAQDIDPRAPLDWLFDSYMSATIPPNQHRTVRALLECQAFMGHTFWIEGIDAAQWPIWKGFIAEYSDQCRNTQLLQKSVFCLVLIGQSTQGAPNEDVCLSVRIYDDRVSRLDMQLYVSAHKKGAYDKDLLEALRSEIIVSLAQWDGSFADEIKDMTFEELLNPSASLDAAHRRGWTNNPGGYYHASWEQGTLQRIGGRVVLHSSICASQDPKELTRRLWQAQLRVLYPFVEEQRRIILEQTRAYLRVPYVTRFGMKILDSNELEIGHIEDILKGNIAFHDREYIWRIEQLRDIRNHLAHFEVIGAELLESKAVAEPLAFNDTPRQAR